MCYVIGQIDYSFKPFRAAAIFKPQSPIGIRYLFSGFFKHVFFWRPGDVYLFCSVDARMDLTPASICPLNDTSYGFVMNPLF